MRIGILGGTFDPVHNGHLKLARAAKKQLQLDTVIFVPAYLPPHKGAKVICASHHRYAMTELAIKSKTGFEISDYEIKNAKKSFSIRMVKAMAKKYGRNAHIFFLAGADVSEQLFTWKDINGIFKLAKFVIADRPGFALNNIPRQVQTITIGALPISSTEIRRRVLSGESIAGLVPDAVEAYIKKNRLYQMPL